MPKKSILNVRSHLEHAELIFDDLYKNGMCPLLDEEIFKIRLINKSILNKHNKKKEAGNRHDIYIGKNNES